MRNHFHMMTLVLLSCTPPLKVPSIYTDCLGPIGIWVCCLWYYKREKMQLKLQNSFMCLKSTLSILKVPKKSRSHTRVMKNSQATVNCSTEPFRLRAA